VLVSPTSRAPVQRASDRRSRARRCAFSSSRRRSLSPTARSISRTTWHARAARRRRGAHARPRPV